MNLNLFHRVSELDKRCAGMESAIEALSRLAAQRQEREASTNERIERLEVAAEQLLAEARSLREDVGAPSASDLADEGGSEVPPHLHPYSDNETVDLETVRDEDGRIVALEDAEPANYMKPESVE